MRATICGGDGGLRGEGALLLEAAGVGAEARGGGAAGGTGGDSLGMDRGFGSGAGACRRTGGSRAGGAGRWLDGNELPRGSAGDGPRGLRKQVGGAEQKTGQRTQDSRGGVSAHVRFLEVRRHQSNFYPIWYVDMG